MSILSRVSRPLVVVSAVLLTVPATAATFTYDLDPVSVATSDTETEVRVLSAISVPLDVPDLTGRVLDSVTLTATVTVNGVFGGFSLTGGFAGAGFGGVLVYVGLGDPLTVVQFANGEAMVGIDEIPVTEKSESVTRTFTDPDDISAFTQPRLPILMSALVQISAPNPFVVLETPKHATATATGQLTITYATSPIAPSPNPVLPNPVPPNPVPVVPLPGAAVLMLAALGSPRLLRRSRPLQGA